MWKIYTNNSAIAEERSEELDMEVIPEKVRKTLVKRGTGRNSLHKKHRP
jgi:hypothetical protein